MSLSGPPLPEYPALPAALPSAHEVEIGLYRDGDNNLDELQRVLIDQAQDCSAHDARVAYFIEDTTRMRKNGRFTGPLHTDRFEITDGLVTNERTTPPQLMSARSTLAEFTADTLSAAMKNNARTTWLDLVNHGAGDGGAFESGDGSIMTEDDIGGAIADGIAQHAAQFPADALRKVDGVLFNACLMATCGMESVLAKAGVRYLGASPEAMIAPGISSTIGSVLADHGGAFAARPSLREARSLASDLTRDVMGTRYEQDGEVFAPAAAFDVFTLDPKKIASMEEKTRTAFAALATAANAAPGMRDAIRSDARAVPGMTRDEHDATPWKADRPAEALFTRFAADARLPENLRTTCTSAAAAIDTTVLAHSESAAFAPFENIDYRDAVGPTIHFPITTGQIDPWAPQVIESDTAFTRAIAANKVYRAMT